MKFNQLHHVSINVDDLEKNGQFYREILGLESIPRPHLRSNGLWFSLGQQQLHLIEVADHQAPKGQHFALKVANIHQAVKLLDVKGIKTSKVRSQPNGSQQCFFQDPAGNKIELNQPAI